MGTVRTDITLGNAADQVNAGRGIIKEAEIRTVAVNAIVDTGAGTLVINDAIRQQLGLAIQETRSVLLADGTRQPVQMTESVDICWKNRHAACRAMVLPNAREVLLGAIPLEDMDLVINPALQELTGAHGDEVLSLAL